MSDDLPRVQMDLDFGAGAYRAWSTPLSSRSPLVCRLALTRSGARVQVCGPPGLFSGDSSDGGLWSLDVRVRQPAGIVGQPAYRADLLTDPRATSWRRGFFSGHLDNICRQARSTHHERAHLARHLELVHRHLQSQMDPLGRQTADRFRFGRGLRWFVYESVVNDSSGRVAQAARACPGLLIIASHLRNTRDVQTSSRIVAQLQEGVALNEIVATVLDAWLPSLPPEMREVPGKVRLTQRLRIRRAGPLVPPHRLWLPHLGALVAEDIPADPEENRTWFEVTRETGLAAMDTRLTVAQRTGLLEFASRHACAIARLCRRRNDGQGDKLGSEMSDLIDYLAATGRVPGRKSSPAALFAESAIWHRTIWQRSDAARLPAETPLATRVIHGCEDWRFGDTRVQLLDTAGDLAGESRRMHHCVGTYVDDARRGSSFFFHGDLAGSPVTIQLRASVGNVVIVQASGYANRVLISSETKVLSTWLTDLNEVLDSRCDGTWPKLRGRFMGQEVQGSKSYEAKSERASPLRFDGAVR